MFNSPILSTLLFALLFGLGISVSYDELLDHAFLAMLVYHDEVTKGEVVNDEAPTKYVIDEILAVDNAFGWLVSKPDLNECTLVVKGTNETKDWLDNLDISTSRMDEDREVYFRVHDGFKHHALRLWEDEDTRKKIEGWYSACASKAATFTFTGHSLGAAAATYFAWAMQTGAHGFPLDDVHKLVTFGQPRLSAYHPLSITSIFDGQSSFETRCPSHFMNPDVSVRVVRTSSYQDGSDDVADLVTWQPPPPGLIPVDPSYCSEAVRLTKSNDITFMRNINFPYSNGLNAAKSSGAVSLHYMRINYYEPLYNRQFLPKEPESVTFCQHGAGIEGICCNLSDSKNGGSVFDGDTCPPHGSISSAKVHGNCHLVVWEGEGYTGRARTYSGPGDFEFEASQVASYELDCSPEGFDVPTVTFCESENLTGLCCDLTEGSYEDSNTFNGSLCPGNDDLSSVHIHGNAAHCKVLLWEHDHVKDSSTSGRAWSLQGEGTYNAGDGHFDNDQATSVRIDCSGNDYKPASSSGGWGGICRCPDGSTYQVADNYDACGSLACSGGTMESCNRSEGPWSFHSVSCGFGIAKGTVDEPAQSAKFCEHANLQGKCCDLTEGDYDWPFDGVTCPGNDQLSSVSVSGACRVHLFLDGHASNNGGGAWTLDTAGIFNAHDGHYPEDMISSVRVDCSENIYVPISVEATSGGSCRCPDGSVYQVAAQDEFCVALECYGGTAGACNGESGPWSKNKVTCGPAREDEQSSNSDIVRRLLQDVMGVVSINRTRHDTANATLMELFKNGN